MMRPEQPLNCSIRDKLWLLGHLLTKSMMSIWGGAEGSKTGFFCILYCMFLHVTNQYLVNIVHPTSCLLSFFVLDSSMPTLLFSQFCRNALILLQLLQKILYRNLSFS